MGFLGWTFLLHLQILCMLLLDVLLVFLWMLLLLVLLWNQASMRIWFLLPRDTIRSSSMQSMLLFSTLCLELDPLCSCAPRRTCDIDAWLSVMPTEHNNFNLTAQEFCDAFAVRYKKSLLSVPSQCDGCGASSSLDHF